MPVLAVGLTTLDLVYAAAAAPGPDEKVQASGQELAAGGPAAGAAVTAAALGSAVTLVTALGRHPLAAFAAAELRGRGVTVLDATPERTAPPPVSSAVVAADGRRSVVSVNASGPAAAPPPALAGLAAAAGAVLVDGHHPRLALAAARAARAGGPGGTRGSGRPAATGAGGLVLLDGGSWKPDLPALLPAVDVAVCSAGFRVPGCPTAAATAAALGAYGIRVVAVTAGPEPVRWWAGGRAGTVPVPAVAAVDTLGAGDAYHGALLHALAGTVAGVEEVVAALAYAAEVAAVRCASPGPRAWLADPALARLRRPPPGREG